jgi:hypothetical protein
MRSDSGQAGAAKAISPQEVAIAIRTEVEEFYYSPDVTGSAPPETDLSWIIGGVLQRLFHEKDREGEKPQP